MTKSIRFDVFGREVLVVNINDRWSVFYLGTDGKRRRAEDIVVPSFITESEIERYLADLCHEWASENYPDVKRLD
ncbi:MAG: hypothetical protein GTO24_08095 [candidate division Zixibacteria bacterium]|nr:hypothetical protein [candidate division Zixibacteria bacterium]